MKDSRFKAVKRNLESLLEDYTLNLIIGVFFTREGSRYNEINVWHLLWQKWCVRFSIIYNFSCLHLILYIFRVFVIVIDNDITGMLSGY